MRALKAPVWRGGGLFCGGLSKFIELDGIKKNRGCGLGICLANVWVEKELSLLRQLFFGGNARARTADLLRVKQAL